MCYRGNNNCNQCLSCNDLLSLRSCMGEPRQIICRGSIVDEYKKG